MIAPMPSEADRLQALHGLGLRPAPEPEYDAICRTACALFGTPMAWVSLVDAETQWFKARCGLDRALHGMVTLGVSVFPARAPDPDQDADGVADPRDRCYGTPIGTVVDERGCPQHIEVRGQRGGGGVQPLAKLTHGQSVRAGLDQGTERGQTCFVTQGIEGRDG